LGRKKPDATGSYWPIVAGHDGLQSANSCRSPEAEKGQSHPLVDGNKRQETKIQLFLITDAE